MDTNAIFLGRKLDLEGLKVNKDTPIEYKLAYICKRFRLSGDLLLYRWIPSGHINMTYYVAMFDGHEARQYLVQKINWYVFKQPVEMMHNLEQISDHIIGSNPNMERRRRLHFHHTDEGNTWLKIDEGEDMEFWRLTNFVENSVSFETADGDPKVLQQSGKAFGRFVNQLKDFDATQLVESIPHFHDTRYRLNTFFTDVDEDVCGRVAECKEDIDLIRKYSDYACKLCDMVEEGKLPIRVTHNDTKTNNVLFDHKTLDPLVIIDLDTCMPGLVCHDFGDTIRFAACTAVEDEKDVSKMKLDLKLFRAFTEGFVGEIANLLTPEEIATMADGAAIITLELASRFLDDYLTGDKYFRIDYAEHNLVRARAQLALFKDMMLHLDEMKEIVNEVAEKNIK